MHIKSKLVKSGNSWCIRLPKDVIQLSGLTPGKAVDLEVRQGRLIIRKPGQANLHNLDRAYEDVKAVWDQALKDVWYEAFGLDFEES